MQLRNINLCYCTHKTMYSHHSVYFKQCMPLAEFGMMQLSNASICYWIHTCLVLNTRASSFMTHIIASHATTIIQLHDMLSYYIKQMLN